MNTFPPSPVLLDGPGEHLLVVPGIGVVIGLDDLAFGRDGDRDAADAPSGAWTPAGLGEAESAG